MPSILINLGSNNTMQVTGTATLFRSATFVGISGFTTSGTPINNSKNINFGVNSGQMPLVVAAGSTTDYLVYDNTKLSLSNFWIQGQQNDGLYIIYQ